MVNADSYFRANKTLGIGKIRAPPVRRYHLVIHTAWWFLLENLAFEGLNVVASREGMGELFIDPEGHRNRNVVPLISSTSLRSHTAPARPPKLVLSRQRCPSFFPPSFHNHLPFLFPLVFFFYSTQRPRNKIDSVRFENRGRDRVKSRRLIDDSYSK